MSWPAVVALYPDDGSQTAKAILVTLSILAVYGVFAMLKDAWMVLCCLARLKSYMTGRAKVVGAAETNTSSGPQTTKEMPRDVIWISMTAGKCFHSDITCSSIQGCTLKSFRYCLKCKQRTGSKFTKAD